VRSRRGRARAAGPAFVNGITIPAGTPDLSSDAAPFNRLGFFSTSTTTPNRNEWYGLSDRGPGGGTLSYDARVQRFTIDINRPPAPSRTSRWCRRSSSRMPRAPSLQRHRAVALQRAGASLDPEGFVSYPRRGNFLVSDEYGPSVYEFKRDGTSVRAFTTPTI